ncbi:SHOCT domain-containing protein [Geotalea sp. SG265]|uniref:SHOCT domain-containing protein n=1 Tax=Geotalea sp. SG265 TaxID=2922867 RepID=UPI001FAF9E46|nr:SHOCT domain-containing protein [Geotalea sp. SG265]
MHKMTFLTFAAVLSISGCAETSPILRANESKSFFEGAVYSGEKAIIGADTTGAQRYRVFHQAATGFIPLQVVREEVEERANKFCGRQGKGIKLLEETTSPQYVAPGNFPRVELIFACLEIPKTTFEDQTYIRLTNLKKLLDDGTITKEEFEQQKARILSH